MAKKAELVIDARQLEQMLAELAGTGDTTLTRAVTSAMRSVAKKASRRTYQNFANLTVKKDGRKSRNAKGRLGDTERGRGKVLNGKLVTIKKLRTPDKRPLIYIGIRGNWKAKFFELGTQERSIGKAKLVWHPKRSFKVWRWWGIKPPPNRGRIKAGFYFKRALKDTEAELPPEMVKALKKAIYKAHQKIDVLKTQQ